MFCELLENIIYHTKIRNTWLVANKGSSKEKEVSIEEIKKFVCINIIMEIVKLLNHRMYWLAETRNELIENCSVCQ